jgi:hypothetical protein
MAIVVHKGKLYASTSMWMDTPGTNNSDKESIKGCQLLVKDSSNSPWRLEYQFSETNLRLDSLYSFTFTTDGFGTKLPEPVSILMCAPTGIGNVCVYSRDDVTGNWTQVAVGRSSKYTDVRSMGLHIDAISGVQRVFMASKDIGIFSGVYDAAVPGRIRWDKVPEFTGMDGRPMAFCECAGSLYFSSYAKLYRRVDGAQPRWELVYEHPVVVNEGGSGLRGLTTTPNPHGNGEVLLMTMEGVTDQILYFDPATGKATIEMNIIEYLSKQFGTRNQGGAIAAYNNMCWVRDPSTGEQLLLIGVAAFLRNTSGPDHTVITGYFIRHLDGRYEMAQIPVLAEPKRSNPVLCGTRTIALSPFPEDQGQIVYAGGYDAAGKPAHNTAWIYRAPLDFVLKNTSFPSSGKDISSSSAKYLVLISIDACRPDYFDFSDIPNIKKLMSEGISYTNAWVGQLRNDTPPGHTAIATGAFPKNNGVLGFGWKDAQTGKIISPTDWTSITTGALNQIITSSGCTSIGSVYKKTFPSAKVAAISSDKYYASAALGADSADCILFDLNDKAVDPTATGANYLTPAGVSAHLAPPEIMNAPELKRKKLNQWDSDTWAVDLALKLFEKEKPEIMLINLPQTDHTGHGTGGITDKPSMAQVINNVDVQVGRLIDAYKQAGIYDQTIFVITADHGMTPWLHTIEDKQISSILSSYGGRGTGRVDYYLNNPAKAGEAAEKIAQLQLQGIHGVYYKLKNQDGTYSYFPAPTTLKSIDSRLDACYRYLASTYASAQGPDLVYFTAENWKSGTSTALGDHGQATWDNQHIPLIMSGPGIRKGGMSTAPARLVDIAPTVLTAMGLKPDKMDGVVLADALAAPARELVALQQAANTELEPLENALKNRHDKDFGK